jgi:hypothetical protein
MSDISKLDQIIFEEIDNYNQALDQLIEAYQDYSLLPDITTVITKYLKDTSVSIESLEKTFRVIDDLNQQLLQLINKMKQEI